jgi:hypothetical protein
MFALQIKETMSSQYKSKIEECMTLWKRDVKEKEAKYEDTRKRLVAAEKEKDDMRATRSRFYQHLISAEFFSFRYLATAYNIL